jgi:hypothetical protein
MTEKKAETATPHLREAPEQQQQVEHEEAIESDPLNSAFRDERPAPIPRVTSRECRADSGGRVSGTRADLSAAQPRDARAAGACRGGAHVRAHLERRRRRRGVAPAARGGGGAGDGAGGRERSSAHADDDGRRQQQQQQQPHGATAAAGLVDAALLTARSVALSAHAESRVHTRALSAAGRPGPHSRSERSATCTFGIS